MDKKKSLVDRNAILWKFKNAVMQKKFKDEGKLLVYLLNLIEEAPSVEIKTEPAEVNRLQCIPIIRTRVYNKYGFVKMRGMATYCPRCNQILNAGPNYQPRHCSNCGHPLVWDSISWLEKEFLGFDQEKREELNQKKEG